MTHEHCQKNIIVAFWLNLVFALIELVGAFFTNSVAIASDAIHDLGDSIAIGSAWYLERYAVKERDNRFPFGYKRFSLLGGLINCLVLILGSLLILRETLPRLWAPEAVHSDGMVWLAIIGLLFNGIAAWRLHHGHSLNENILSLHFLEDVLGWVAVLIVALAMKLGDFAILDPLLALAIAAWVIWNAAKRLRAVLRIFLQSLPEELELNVLEDLISSQPGVLGVHDTRVWSLDGRHHVLSSHVKINDDMGARARNTLKVQIREALAKRGILDVTLEFECEGDSC